MTVQGNLAFQSGALYLVQVNPSTASSANVIAGGAATLAGTVQAVFASGSYASRTYTILAAAGGLAGTTFNALTTTNLPAGFTPSLSYTATDVILNLTAALGAGRLERQQPAERRRHAQQFLQQWRHAAAGFVSVFGLTGGNLGNALSLLSGEAATGGQQVGFQMTTQFLGLMLDPFVDGRSGVAGAGGPALGFAPERETLPEDIALAYSSVLKAPPMNGAGDLRAALDRVGRRLRRQQPHAAAIRRWSAATISPPARRASPAASTIISHATAWLASRSPAAAPIGAWRRGLAAAGAMRSRPASTARRARARPISRRRFAFTNHWMSTDRFAFAAIISPPIFKAQSFGGTRRERLSLRHADRRDHALCRGAGAKLPHAELQRDRPQRRRLRRLPTTAAPRTDTRSEFGARFDRLLAINPNAVLTLRARLAWAHDWVSDPTLAAAFQALPGTSFIVNGATPAKDSALASAGAELRLANGVSLFGKFDGEFASRSSTYAGTGTVRYAW